MRSQHRCYCAYRKPTYCSQPGSRVPAEVSLHPKPVSTSNRQEHLYVLAGVP